MPVAGTIADDFTGTASAGSMLAKKGVKTGLFCDLRSDTPAGEYEAVFVSSNTRNLTHELAYKKVSDLTRVLKETGVKYFSKKIDSTLRGQIGAETDAMLDILGEEYIAVMVPALPEAKRVMAGGCFLVDSVPVHRTLAGKDILSPVKESYVPHLMESQSVNRAGLIAMETVLGPRENIRRRMSELMEAGVRIIIADAVTDEDIDKIAWAAEHLPCRILAVDPGPFTARLAEKHCRKESGSSSPAGRRKCSGKTVLMIAGSANERTKRQMDHLWEKEGHRRISIDAQQLIQAAEEMRKEIIGEILKEAEEIIRGEAPCLSLTIETGLHGSLADLETESRKRGCSREELTGHINRSLGAIAAGILEKEGRENIAGIFVTGGDTMLAVCRALQVESIEITGALEPQVDIGRIRGMYEGLPIIVKGGFCGSEFIMEQIVEKLEREGADKR